jgi:hypothetical protein
MFSGVVWVGAAGAAGCCNFGLKLVVFVQRCAWYRCTDQHCPCTRFQKSARGFWVPKREIARKWGRRDAAPRADIPVLSRSPCQSDVRHLRHTGTDLPVGGIAV